MAAPIIVRPVIRMPEKAKRERDWAAFLISVVSLLISLASFFFSTLLESDDVRVIIDQVPFLTVDEGTLYVRDPVRLTVVNYGNRAASILSLVATVRTVAKDEGADAPCISKTTDGLWSGYEVQFGLDPFVLKPGDVVNVESKTLAGVAAQQVRKEKNFYTISKRVYAPKSGDRLLVCLRAKAATVEKVVARWEKPVLRYEVLEDQELPDHTKMLTVDSNFLVDTARPIIIVNDNRWFGKMRALFIGSGSG